jgi:hypothetical protein
MGAGGAPPRRLCSRGRADGSHLAATPVGWWRPTPKASLQSLAPAPLEEEREGEETRGDKGGGWEGVKIAVR